MNKPRLLDLFCGAGGAAMGYSRAGFEVVGVDHVDQPHYPFEFHQADALLFLSALQKDGWTKPKGERHVVCGADRGRRDSDCHPRVGADDAEGCSGGSRFMAGRNQQERVSRSGDAYRLSNFDAVHASPPCQAYIRSGMVAKDGRHPDLLGPIRERLEASGLPWVIENVPGAPMRPDVVLCGSMFGLGVRRHRWFETNVGLSPLTPVCDHTRRITGVYGHPHGKGGAWRNGARPMLPSDQETWSREMGIDWMTPAELTQAIPPAYTEFIGAQLLASIEKVA